MSKLLFLPTFLHFHTVLAAFERQFLFRNRTVRGGKDPVRQRALCLHK